ncbi:MAG: DUF983 domain-containing protein [Hellea sp.]|nr:DUF983 domain-containing protein [Hellea sp.]
METISKKIAIWRGLRSRCPSCGQASLYRAYLKPVDECPSCGVTWSDVRADDGPAWATMLVVLHGLAPLFHLVAFGEHMSMWKGICLLSVIAVIMCLWLLPRMKGLFIAIIWSTGAPTS